MTDLKEHIMEMYNEISIKDLPTICKDYLQIVGDQIGLCGEIFLSVFAYYAWKHEGYTLEGSYDEEFMQHMDKMIRGNTNEEAGDI